MSSWKEASYRRVAEEASKCVMLCSNCHREVHAGLRQIPESIRRFDLGLFDQRKLEIQAQTSLTFEEHQYSSRKRVDWRAVDIQSLRAQGKTWKQIAALAGVSVSTLLKRFYKLGGQPAASVVWPQDDVLRELVWGKPVVQVALDLGVSGVAVKKRCSKKQIPTPPRGYWSRNWYTAGVSSR